MNQQAEHWIRALALEPHPEGGYFRESYRSTETLSQVVLAAGDHGDRSVSTAIYYLLRPGDRSRLHRLRADELWHLYDGGPLTLHVLHPTGDYEPRVLGRELHKGQALQQVVPRGSWFGAEATEGFSLVGCTVAPGFTYEDFELGGRKALLAQYPQHQELVSRLTSNGG
ncbi:MAG: cupin domain-containing protein [Candidatus Eisenbacteria bacterium]